LGDGGDQLHQWAYCLASWRKLYGQTGGERDRADEMFEKAGKNIAAVLDTSGVAHLSYRVVK
jgi:hypothetical protein